MIWNTGPAAAPSWIQGSRELRLRAMLAGRNQPCDGAGTGGRGIVMAEEPNNDKYEGRLLIAFNALIDGQKRTLRALETAIEKYSGVDMEIAKFNRKLNAVQEVSLQQYGEMLSRTDALRTTSDRQHAEMLARTDALQEISVRLRDEMSKTRETLDRQHAGMLARTDVLQESSVRQGDELSKMRDAVDRQNAEMLSRTDLLQAKTDLLQETMLHQYTGFMAQIGKIDNRLSADFSKLGGRMDAIVGRFDEAERFGDERMTDIKKLQIETASQFNDLLSAMQLATASGLDVRSLEERVSELERRMGLGGR
jgi:hypothetical protein